MAWIRRRKNRPFIILAVFVAVWCILPQRLVQTTRDGFYQLQAPAWVAVSHLGDLVQFWQLRSQSKAELIESGRDLARLNAAYSLRIQENTSLRMEIERLEAVLGIPSEPDFHYEVARVIRRDITLWWQQMTIRKGSKHGLREGQAVVYGGGIIGRIKEVHSTTAIVSLVSSPAFRVAANIEGDIRPVTYQGVINAPFTDPRGEVRDVVPGITIPTGESRRLVSSRLGGNFPQGLTIGHVDALEPGPDGLFQHGTVRLPAQLYFLQEVSVAIPVEPRVTGNE